MTTTLSITEPDDAIAAALDDAQLPALLPALAQALDDFSLLRPDLAPSPSPLDRIQGGMTPAQQAAARELALQAIKRFRDGGSRPAPPASRDQVLRIVDYLTGGAASEEYVPLLLEELAYPAEDARAPAWTMDQLAPGRPFSVAVIGSGMSGILAGIRLGQAGIPFVILEKNADVGGTWFENTYPGARVDSSNHLYSYSFAQKADWPYYFSTQGVLLDYFRACAADHGVREHIRFNTEVESMAFDDETCTWRLALRTPAGRETLHANAVITAVGQLNRPKLPEIKGRAGFEGPWWHSAEWNHDVDLAGKRVGVIGNGASASQFIPVVANQAEQLTIFQRTPSWYIPVPNYHDEVPAGLMWLFRHVPYYAQWYRFWLFWTSAEGLLSMAKVDPGWSNGGLSVSAGNDQLRQLMAGYMAERLAGRTDLLEKVIPEYPPASKRIVLDNGIWPETLLRDNVRLVTEPIREITPHGVLTGDGEEHRFDVIIYGTGFQASRFLAPMKATGRGGVDLNEQWEGDARAYLGVVVPNFPNLFCLYGPNTNIVVNGSIVYFSECEMQYVMGCLRMLLAEGWRAIDCRKDVHDAYNERIDAGNLAMAWGVSKVPSWYKNERGRVAQNWPFTLLEYWQQTREPDPRDYIAL